MTLDPKVTSAGTGKYVRQGQTAKDAFGSNPNATAMGKAAAEPRDLKP